MNHFIRFAACLTRWLFVVIVISFACILCFWLWWPYDVIEVENPIKILNAGKLVEPGGKLLYKISYNKKMNVIGVVTRKIVNTYKIDYADVFATAPIGKDEDEILLTVPAFSLPGEHYLWWSASYKVNPVRTITVTAESEKFFVVGKDKESITGPPGPVGPPGHIGKTGEKGATGTSGKNFWGNSK